MCIKRNCERKVFGTCCCLGTFVIWLIHPTCRGFFRFILNIIPNTKACESFRVCCESLIRRLKNIKSITIIHSSIRWHRRWCETEGCICLIEIVASAKLTVKIHLIFKKRSSNHFFPSKFI